ncbi:MAG: alanyl-tRNA editing protein [Acidobacteriota bacterium]
MAIMAYDRNAYLTELATDISETGQEGSHFFAVTADTIFYPEGGGQPADRGILGGLAVLDVQLLGGVIRHTLDGPVDLGPVHMKLDWDRRYDHMQQHTGQHLLTAVAADVFGWKTTAFHLGERVSDIELDAPDLHADDLKRLEEAVNAEIPTGRAVRARTVSRAEYDRLAVRSRGLPDGHAGDIRLIEIEGLDLNTCGGTHLRSTAELGSLCLLDTERLRGGTRVFFVAGNRVRRLLAEHEDRAARLRQTLDAPNDQLVDEAVRREAHLRSLSKKLRNAMTDLAGFEAARLASESGEVITAHWEERDMPFLQAVARDLVVHAPSVLALLTAGADDDGVFLLTAGPDTGLEVSTLGSAIAEALGGRGGGRGSVFQGKATRLERRKEALALLETV